MRKLLQLLVLLLLVGGALVGVVFVSTAASSSSQDCTPMDIQYGHCAQSLDAVCTVRFTRAANGNWRVDVALTDSPAAVPPFIGMVGAGPLFGTATFTADGQMTVSCATAPRQFTPCGAPTRSCPGGVIPGPITGFALGFRDTTWEMPCDAFRGATLDGAAKYVGGATLVVADDDNGSATLTCHAQLLVAGSPPPPETAWAQVR